MVLHPGHISGPGWPVINPAGNLDPRVWTALATGQPVPLPDHGLGVLNHVHADDVAQAFELALARPAAAGAQLSRGGGAGDDAARARGGGGRVVRPGAGAGVRGLAPVRGAGRDRAAAVTREHTFRGIAASIAAGQQVLGYAPRFSSLAALREALAWLVSDGQVDVADQDF